jgi:hypothetical protein
MSGVGKTEIRSRLSPGIVMGLSETNLAYAICDGYILIRSMGCLMTLCQRVSYLAHGMGGQLCKMKWKRDFTP